MSLEILLNTYEKELLVEAIQGQIRKMVQNGRYNDLILNNGALRTQKSEEQLDEINKETKKIYEGIILLKRIANRIQPHTYGGEAGDEENKSN